MQVTNERRGSGTGPKLAQLQPRPRADVDRVADGMAELGIEPKNPRRFDEKIARLRQRQDDLQRLLATVSPVAATIPQQLGQDSPHSEASSEAASVAPPHPQYQSYHPSPQLTVPVSPQPFEQPFENKYTLTGREQRSPPHPYQLPPPHPRPGYMPTHLGHPYPLPLNMPMMSAPMEGSLHHHQGTYQRQTSLQIPASYMANNTAVSFASQESPSQQHQYHVPQQRISSTGQQSGPRGWPRTSSPSAPPPPPPPSSSSSFTIDSLLKPTASTPSTPTLTTETAAPVWRERGGSQRVRRMGGQDDPFANRRATSMKVKKSGARGRVKVDTAVPSYLQAPVSPAPESPQLPYARMESNGSVAYCK